MLVAFDFDGTLAPIVSDPARAALRVRTRRLLTAVTSCYPCAVISGRSLSDLTEKLHDVPVWHVAGNHGAEPSNNGAAATALVREWVPHLRRRLLAVSGVVVEDKKYSVAVHYRHAVRKRTALRAIDRATRTLRGFRRLGGKQAVNLVPRDSPDKGAALEQVRRTLACECAIYVGDDDTDEDAFGVSSPDRLLAIRVGRVAPRRSSAPFYLESQRQIDALLAALVQFRPYSARRR